MSWRHLLEPAGAMYPPGKTCKKRITVCRNGDENERKGMNKKNMF
jgi:hypothetical protein